MSSDIEGEAAAALAVGDFDGAATAILRGYGREILGYLFAVVRDETRADEAFAQFSADLWAGLPGFRRESSCRTWAYTLAWHAALRVLTDPYARRGQPIESSQWSKLVAEVRESTAAYRRSSVKDRVAALREQLAPDEQTLLVLRIDRDLPWRDVAEIMGMAEPALRKRYERLKERLAELARAEGLLDE